MMFLGNNFELAEYLHLSQVQHKRIFSKLKKVHNNVESVAQVVGRRTQDQKVPGSNPETGLIFKVAVKL